MRKLSFVLLIVLSFSVGIIQAQTNACSGIVEQALTSVDDLCTGLDRNSACYGASEVESTTAIQPRPRDFFITPGDRGELGLFKEINPQPLNEITREFGVSVLNMQANLPDTVPGQAVIFLIVGGAQLTNEVTQNDDQETPFQSFYFLPGIGGSTCYEAEPMLTIQAPGNIAVTFTFNGVETEMSPGTLLTITPSVCTIHRGNIVQRVGAESAVLLANQTIDIRFDENGGVVPTNLRGISEREYIRGQQIQEAVNALAAANGWEPQFITPPRRFEPELPAANSPCAVQHTVKNGETLHKIAQAYNTSILSIAEANDLSNPRLIYPGQVLCIPDPDSGFEPLPPGF